MRKALNKKQVYDAIAGTQKPPRVPVCYTTWYNPLVFKGFDMVRAVFARRFRDDVAVGGWSCLRNYLYAMDKEKYGSTARCIIQGFMTGGAPTMTKAYKKAHNIADDVGESVDNQILVEDMEKIDEFLVNFPDANKVGLLFKGPSLRYKLSWNFSCLFECHWTVRGMENALMDFYLYPEETHKLYRAFTDYMKILIVRSKKELKADGFFVTDDIGTQNGPFFSMDIFNEFFRPYYQEMIDLCHSLGMHFWLHTCGNVEQFIPSFIEMGLDVLHPLQKSAMNQPEIFDKYHDQITFLYGFDVQHVIPEGTADEVEEEAKRTMDLFSKANGRLVYTTGNVVQGDCPITSLERLMKVTHMYNPYKKQKEEGTFDKPYVSGKEIVINKDKK